MQLRLAYHPEGGATLTTMKHDTTAPSVRLAHNPGPIDAYGALSKPDAGGAFGKVPSVRLALTISESDGGAMRSTNLERAVNGSGEAPALLVSYVYLEPFLKNQHRYLYRDWVLDSGAFSAHNSGRTISLDKYIDTARRLLDADPTLSEVFALDVIGDGKASLKNCEAMWKAGIAAIPCFHRGTPEAELKHIAKDYPKIALGGVALLKGAAKMKFAQQAFARVWPCRIHGFGFGSESQVMALPWHSVDATNWELGPCKFGRWQSFGQMSVRGSNQNLRAEVEWYLRLEARARKKWAQQMAELDARCAPVVRLAAGSKVGSLINSKINP